MAERHKRVTKSPKPRGPGRKAPPDPRAPLESILAQVDLEKTVRDLLREADNRLKLQLLSLLLPYKFGKPAQCVEPTGPREPVVVRMVVEGIGE